MKKNNGGKREPSSASNGKKPSAKAADGGKRRISLLFLITVLVLLAAIAALSVCYVVAVYYYTTYQVSAPINYASLRPEQYVTNIYDSNANHIDKLHGEENREYATISEIPVYLKNAVVAVEDMRFYSHGGVDLESVARAVYVNMKERAFVEGASTITQQLVKNNLLKDTSVELNRKIQEQCLAYKLENDLTAKLGGKRAAKDFILEQYLNTVNLAHGMNGVKMAAKYYFGKELSELTLSECAAIASIIKNPSRYSPLNSPESNWERTRLVLYKMLEQEMISYYEYDDALKENIYTSEHIINSGDTVIHSYFVDQVINEVARDLMYEKGLDEKSAYQLVYSGGLSIYTTFDPEIQAIIDDAFENGALFPKSGSVINVLITYETEQGIVRKNGVVESDAQADSFIHAQRQSLSDAGYTIVNESAQKIVQPQGAFAVIDYRTGRVPAFGAGRGEKKYNLAFNRATQAKRQPGSCFKVLAAYLPALDTGVINAKTLIADEPFTITVNNEEYTPDNYDFSFRGDISVRTAIRDSINVAAVKTLVEVGYDKAFEYLKKLGFTTLVEERASESGKSFTDLGPALALGGLTDGVTTLELAAAFGAIANEGMYNKPVFYTKVIAYDGTILLENKIEPVQVITPETSYILTDMMADVVERGTGKLAKFDDLSVQIAGKTGTSTDDRDLSFAGYTPYYAAAVWQGYDTPKELDYDKSYHLLLWRNIMERIHKLKGHTSGQFVYPDYMDDELLGRNVAVPVKPEPKPVVRPRPQPVAPAPVQTPEETQEEVPDILTPDTNDEPPDGEMPEQGMTETPAENGVSGDENTVQTPEAVPETPENGISDETPLIEAPLNNDNEAESNQLE